MKFVKQNLTLVICGAVVLLAILSAFYPTGSLRAAFQETVAGDFRDRLAGINKYKNTQLIVPAYPTATSPATQKGVPTDNLIAGKETANKQMKEEAKGVVETGAKANRRNRIDVQGNPLLNGVAQKNYLPKIKGSDPNEFKNRYNDMFALWLTQLTGQTQLAGPNGAMSYPPKLEELTAAFATKQAAAAAAGPAGLGGLSNGPGTKEFNDYCRAAIVRRANELYMYVDQPDPANPAANGIGWAFQRRPWLDTDSPPNEQQIFEALVDCWFQSDVVSAIAAVNAVELNKPGVKKNVGTAPIKRLIHIAVGSDALTPRLALASGQAPAGAAGQSVGLFYQPPAAASATPTGDVPPPPSGAAAPNTIALERSLTGRASGADYDVVMMQIVMDIDPSYLNRFCDALYRQNMGYTVLNIRSKTVDPLDRASSGFLYGDAQAIEVEITVEGLLYRDWTQKLMPPAIMAMLNIPAPAATNP